MPPNTFEAEEKLTLLEVLIVALPVTITSPANIAVAATVKSSPTFKLFPLPKLTGSSIVKFAYKEPQLGFVVGEPAVPP